MANKLTCIPVRSMRLLSGSGATCEDPLVHCPVRGATELATCEACEHMEAITADARGRADSVICRPSLPLWARLLERARKLPDTPIHRLISCDLVCVTCDASPRQVADLMAERRLEAVAVVDYEHCALGLVSRDGLLQADAFGPNVQRAVTIEQHETLARAVELMMIEGVTHLVVVDRGEHVIGMLDASQLARHLVQRLQQPSAIRA
jgi:CBS domain-containing protein